MLKASLIYAAALCCATASAQSTSHFGLLQMNSPSTAGIAQLHCELITCDGRENGRWVQATITDGKVNLIKVLYNAKKLDGNWEISHTEDLTDAIREHSYANSHKLPDFAMQENSDGQVLAWADLTNRIVYRQDPEDEAKGIMEVVYVQADAPVLTHSKRSPSLDKLMADTWNFISAPPK